MGKDACPNKVGQHWVQGQHLTCCCLEFVGVFTRLYPLVSEERFRFVVPVCFSTLPSNSSRPLGSNLGACKRFPPAAPSFILKGGAWVRRALPAVALPQGLSAACVSL